MARILVTGGFGFLGSHLVEELTADPDNHVHVVDNMSSAPLAVEAMLEELGPPPNLTYSLSSVRNFLESTDITDEHFDEIYHLASFVGPAGVLAHAGSIVPEIVFDAKRILDRTMKWGAKLLDVSSSEVYGGGKEGFCTESTARIISPIPSARLEYAVGKLAAEVMLQNECSSHGLDARIVRPFNIAGPRQSPKGGFVLPRFVQQALMGEPVTVFGDGSQIRAFTHVKDMVSGIVKAMHRGSAGEVYNVGNPLNKTTISDLADRVIAISGSSSEKTLADPRMIFGDSYAEAADKYPDASRATVELGWTPQFGIDEVIAHTVDFWRPRIEHATASSESTGISN